MEQWDRKDIRHIMHESCFLSIKMQYSPNITVFHLSTIPIVNQVNDFQRETVREEKCLSFGL